MDILKRYRAFCQRNQYGVQMKNRGLGLMSEAERAFLLEEKAIGTDPSGEWDFINIDTYYLQDAKGTYTKLPPEITYREAQRKAGIDGCKLCGVPEKYTEWHNRFRWENRDD